MINRMRFGFGPRDGDSGSPHPKRESYNRTVDSQSSAESASCLKPKSESAKESTEQPKQRQ